MFITLMVSHSPPFFNSTPHGVTCVKTHLGQPNTLPLPTSLGLEGMWTYLAQGNFSRDNAEAESPVLFIL